MSRDERMESASGSLFEPEVPDRELTKIELIRWLNWFSAYSDDVTLKKYTIEYASRVLSDKRLDVVSNLYLIQYRTYGALCRLLNKGGQLDSKSMESLNNWLSTISKASYSYDEPNEVKKKPRKKIKIESE